MQPGFGLRGKKKNSYIKNGYPDDNYLRTRETVSQQPQISSSLLRSASHVVIALFQSEKKQTNGRSKSKTIMYDFSFKCHHLYFFIFSHTILPCLRLDLRQKVRRFSFVCLVVFSHVACPPPLVGTIPREQGSLESSIIPCRLYNELGVKSSASPF